MIRLLSERLYKRYSRRLSSHYSSMKGINRVNKAMYSGGKESPNLVRVAAILILFGAIVGCWSISATLSLYWDDQRVSI